MSNSRSSVSRQQREASKRQRERRKAERAARKRERRFGKRERPSIAGPEEPEDVGRAPRAGRKPKVFSLVDEDVDEDAELESLEDSDDFVDQDDELTPRR